MAPFTGMSMVAAVPVPAQTELRPRSWQVGGVLAGILTRPGPRGGGTGPPKEPLGERSAAVTAEEPLEPATGPLNSTMMVWSPGLAKTFSTKGDPTWMAAPVTPSQAAPPR